MAFEGTLGDVSVIPLLYYSNQYFKLLLNLLAIGIIQSYAESLNESPLWYNWFFFSVKVYHSIHILHVLSHINSFCILELIAYFSVWYFYPLMLSCRFDSVCNDDKHKRPLLCRRYSAERCWQNRGLEHTMIPGLLPCFQDQRIFTLSLLLLLHPCFVRSFDWLNTKVADAISTTRP